MQETQERESAGMGTENSSADANWLAAVGQSSLLWGGALTVGFYQAIPYLPVKRELAQRYFCGHPLEYAIAGLFFMGIAILALKMFRLNTEKAALQAEELGDADLPATGDAQEMAGRLEAHLKSLPRAWRQTCLLRRISDVCRYVRGRRSADGLEEHLKYLADQSYDRAHESFGLVRTINWAVPIIGFLGTVVGITLAIANVTPDQLDSSLNAVTGGLAVAFDTTALSLSLTLVLVFFYFVVERSEQQILSRVEDFGSRRLACLFPISNGGSTGTLADVQHEAARQLLEKTEAVISWQTELWKDSLESLRSRWTETLADQQGQLNLSLQEGMASTLADHSQQLAELRGGLLEAFQKITQQVQQQIADAQAKQNQKMDALVTVLFEKTTDWQKQLAKTTSVMQQELEELKAHKEVLLKVVVGEEELVRLQNRLTDNLEAVRTAEAFEQTLHSLSAAVHLLTARTRPNAA